VIHEDRERQLLRRQQRDIKRRILMRPHRRAHPIEDKFTLAREGPVSRMRRDTLGKMVWKRFRSEHGE
jgi:hypothetical protein